jgi:hypothetical protein
VLGPSGTKIQGAHLMREPKRGAGLRGKSPAGVNAKEEPPGWEEP